jgi:outer membrane immunogenic protein
MKRIIILSAVLLVAGFTYAQTPTFGIKAGLNLTNFVGDPDPDSEFKTGIAAGIFTNIPVSRGFSFEPSLEYSQKGARFTTSTDTEVESRISYIDVPLMAKVDVAPSFALFAGPQVSFFVDQETKLVNDSSTLTFEGDNDSYRKSLAGGKVGLSYNFGTVMLNASYATDFQNLYNDNPGDSDLKNQAIHVGLAFGF